MNFEEIVNGLREEVAGAEAEALNERADEAIEQIGDDMYPIFEYVDMVRRSMLGRGWTDEGAERFAMAVYNETMMAQSFGEVDEG